MTKAPHQKHRSLFALKAGETRGSTRVGLQRLLFLRGLVTLAGLVGTFVFHAFSPLALPLPAVAILLLVITISLAIGAWRVRHASLITQNELILNLFLDVSLIVFLLIFTGGASNPLISYLLVTLAVAATLLSTAWASLFALIAMAIYTTFLVIGMTTDVHSSHMMQSFQTHLVGMWVTFMVSALLITLFVGRMASAIRTREMTLASFRENEMRNEQLVAIGTLAAGTAHALGTPLSTMSVLLSDTEHLSPEDTQLLKEQVKRCRRSLDQLTGFYHKSEQQDQQETIARMQSEIADYIVNIHPKAPIVFNTQTACADLMINHDLTIRHAIINIIENAIRAANSEVSVSFALDERQSDMLLIDIEDDGPGIPAQVMENMGEPFISTKQGNMGLGIFLANASIQRHNGTIEMYNKPGGGARTLIRVPLAESTDSAVSPDS